MAGRIVPEPNPNRRAYNAAEPKRREQDRLTKSAPLLMNYIDSERTRG